MPFLYLASNMPFIRLSLHYIAYLFYRVKSYRPNKYAHAIRTHLVSVD